MGSTKDWFPSLRSVASQRGGLSMVREGHWRFDMSKGLKRLYFFEGSLSLPAAPSAPIHARFSWCCGTVSLHSHRHARDFQALPTIIVSPSIESSVTGRKAGWANTHNQHTLVLYYTRAVALHLDLISNCADLPFFLLFPSLSSSFNLSRYVVCWFEIMIQLM